MASYSRHYSFHVAACMVGMASCSALGALCLAAAWGLCTFKPLSQLGTGPRSLSLVGFLLLLACVAMAIRLWKLVRLPLRQTEFFVGAMESRDTTARLPQSDDPVLGPVLSDMNRVLHTYCLDRAGMESQRQYYDRVLRVMAHELRNSVTPIISLTDWMRTHTVSDEERAEFLNVIYSQADGIRGFLEHYQKLTCLPNPTRTDIPVRLLFKNLRLVLSREPSARRISYSISGAPILHADEELVRLALQSIVRNAIHAIEGQGDGYISLSASESPEGVRMVVSNNGPLIPASETEQIFQPFYSTKEGGTGIGLALARRIAEMHGGTLTCESNPPLTMFTFVFPE